MIGVPASTTDFKNEVQTLYYLVSEGDAVFKRQTVAIVIGDNKWGHGRAIQAPEDGVVTGLHCENGAWLQFSNGSENAHLTNERCEYELMSYVPLPQAIESGIIQTSDPARFMVEIKAPLADNYFLSENCARIRCGGNGLQIWWSGFVVVERFVDFEERTSVPLVTGDKIVTVMPEEWHKRFSKAMKKKAEEARLKDKTEILKDEQKKIETQIRVAKNEIKRHEAERDKAIAAAQDAEKFISQAEATAAEIIRGAERKGEASAATIVSRLEQEAEDKKSAILESARRKRREATELKKSAEAEAQQTVDAATSEAQTIIAATQADAATERQAITDNADRLNLEAVVARLYELQDKGELPKLMERPALRRLYIALGEMLSEAQGFAAPETRAQLENQNRMDEIKAMNYALAKQIRDAEDDEFLPDVVRDRMIEQLLDMTEAKGGSIVKKAVDDG
jgi:vacuolar-type H+-ATPase subunit H